MLVLLKQGVDISFHLSRSVFAVQVRPNVCVCVCERVCAYVVREATSSAAVSLCVQTDSLS